MRHLTALLTLAALTGCAAQTLATPGANDLSGAAAVRGRTGDAARGQQSKGSKPRLGPHGGTMLFRKIRLHGTTEFAFSVGYAKNSLTSHTYVGEINTDGAFDGSCFPFPPNGYAAAWSGVLEYPWNYTTTFDTGNESLTLTGSGLNPSRQYTWFYYVSYGNSCTFELVSQQSVSISNGAITVPSPLENGYALGSSNAYQVWILGYPI